MISCSCYALSKQSGSFKNHYYLWGAIFSVSLPLYCKMPPETWRNKLFVFVFIDLTVAMLSFSFRGKASNPFFFYLLLPGDLTSTSRCEEAPSSKCSHGMQDDSILAWENYLISQISHIWKHYCFLLNTATWALEWPSFITLEVSLTLQRGMEAPSMIY